MCVLLVDRANYGRLKPVMHAIQDHQDLQLQVVVAGTMPLERFGRAMDIVRNDGFPIDGQVLMELEGSVPISMAKSVGFGVIEFANEFHRLDPDVVLIIGDRYEALAATIAASAARSSSICRDSSPNSVVVGWNTTSRNGCAMSILAPLPTQCRKSNDGGVRPISSAMSPLGQPTARIVSGRSPIRARNAAARWVLGK